MPYRVSARPEEKPEYRHGWWKRFKRVLLRLWVRVNIYGHTNPIWPILPLRTRYAYRDGYQFIKLIPSKTVQDPPLSKKVNYALPANPPIPEEELKKYIRKSVLWHYPHYNKKDWND